MVAAGAAIGALPELAADFGPGSPLLRLCRGAVVFMEPGEEGQAYPLDAPSLVGPTYLAAYGPGQVVLGATKQWHVTPEARPAFFF